MVFQYPVPRKAVEELSFSKRKASERRSASAMKLS